MKKERGADRQLSGCVWAAVLAPAVSVLPGLCARQAGAAGWLALLAAWPAVLLLGRVLDKGGLAGLCRSGTAWGRLFTIIYIMWAILLGGARLRLSGERMAFTARQQTQAWHLLVVLVVAAVWLVRGKTDVFVRAAAVFSRILTVLLVVVLVLTVPQMQLENVWPLWKEDVPEVFLSAAFVLGVFGYGVYGAFLGEDMGARGNWYGRTAMGCVLLAGLQLSILGNMGARLAGALGDSFLTLGKHVGVEGAFQRVESLLAAVWLLADLSLFGLLLLACRKLAGNMVKGSAGWVTVAGAAAFLLGSLSVFRDATVARRFEYNVAPVGNLVLGAAIPMASVLFGAGKKNGTSCALNKENEQI